MMDWYEVERQWYDIIFMSRLTCLKKNVMGTDIHWHLCNNIFRARFTLMDSVFNSLVRNINSLLEVILKDLRV